jgi:hypothetical protein
LLPAIREQIPVHLRRCAGRELDYPDETGEFAAAFRSHKEENCVRKEAIRFLWYPWAIAAAANWLGNAEAKGLPDEQVNAVRQCLGHLVVELGDAAAKDAVSGWTFKAAETLLGFDAVPP